MKRIFISFAIEDAHLRDFLKGQTKNTYCPFEFVDMSVKKPWDSEWKTNCKKRINSCDGVISIITKNTKSADGQIWEMKCAKDQGLPIIGIYGNADHLGIRMPSECEYIRVMDWTWPNISNWIDSI